MVRLVFPRGSSRAVPYSGPARLMRRRRAPGRRRNFRSRAHRYRGKFAQKVKRVLMNNAETKYVRDENISAITPFNSIVQNISDFYRCFPQLTQGTLSAQRIGQRVTPTAIIVRLNVAFDVTDALSRDLEVHVWFLTSKQQKSVYQAKANVAYNITNGFVQQGYQELLDNGDGTNTYFSGNFLSCTKPLNKDQWSLIKHYKIHLYKGSGTSNNNQVANNEKRHASIVCRLPKHQLIYDQQSDTLPTNYMPVMCLGYRYLDGTAADTGAGVLKVQMASEMRFKDV
jgi:hypothetical protein